MADQGRESRGRSLTWLWMLLAVVVVGGFLFWLGSASEPTAPVAVVEEDQEEEANPLDAGATVVPKDTLAADKGRYEGQRIRVPQIQATGTLGPRIFWGELGDPSRQVPILVRMDSAAAAAVDVQSGSTYSITGDVLAMSDSLATAWGEQDEFLGEGEQMQAAFADYYIQANSVRPARGGAPAPQGGAQQQPQGSG